MRNICLFSSRVLEFNYFVIYLYCFCFVMIFFSTILISYIKFLLIVLEGMLYIELSNECVDFSLLV